MSNGSPYYHISRRGPPINKLSVVIIALIVINVYFDNIVLKIVFGGLFYGVWAVVIYAALLRPVYRLLLKLFNKIKES
jgi:hypothetical protein